MRTLLAVIAGLAVLAACETVEGYRQEMATWQGRHGDDLLVAWGPPDRTASLSDGRELWAYEKSYIRESAGYYRDETRSVTRTYVDADGIKQQETISETFPVWEPPSTWRSACETRFVIGPGRRVEQISFEGDACVASERNS